MNKSLKLDRREMLKLSLMWGSATLIGSRAFGQNSCYDQVPIPIEHDTIGIGVGGEEVPTSPFILRPFNDPLPIPTALKPGYRTLDGELRPDMPWHCRYSNGFSGDSIVPPGPGDGQQDACGYRPMTSTDPRTRRTIQLPYAGKHQLWPGTAGTVVANYPQPVYYHIRLQVRPHAFTTSPVMPVDKNGRPVSLPAGARAVFDTGSGGYYLPPSTVYGFNGTFPGPMINAEYGQPVCVRFENDLDLNPLCLDRQNFGAPDWSFLTHLHNGHTAPESDGQPHHMTLNEGGYQPGEWCDNLYLMYPAGGDEREKQSFLWFHDHRMHYTSSNVYKGMVGLMPHYDPVLDPGDETGTYSINGNKTVTSPYALRLPGRRVDNGDGTFDVKYDIPLALYDCLLDDGVTSHQDFHNGTGEFHPEWWGKSFFKHYPNHGFVGDIFTVNGTAYPVLHVFQRKYRLRFLDASIARIYRLSLMSSSRGPLPAPGTQGQWQLPDGRKCMRLTQIATDGGLLPKPIVRDDFELWPAKRREFVVDFTRYKDGTPTTPGDVIYLVNDLEMEDGRKPDWDRDRDYQVPILKIVIEGPPPEPDLSVVPPVLRPLAPLPEKLSKLPRRKFKLERGNLGGEAEWLINGLQYDPEHPLALPKMGQPEVWEVENGGGGWVHPMHMHMEEHRTISRDGKSDRRNPDDIGREDVIALSEGEEVTVYRNFRTFAGKYVAHCHNLAHEDHNMMFGFTIVP